MQHSEDEVPESILQQQEADSLEAVPVVVHKILVQLPIVRKGKQETANTDGHQDKSKEDCQ